MKSLVYILLFLFFSNSAYASHIALCENKFSLKNNLDYKDSISKCASNGDCAAKNSFEFQHSVDVGNCERELEEEQAQCESQGYQWKISAAFVMSVCLKCPVGTSEGMVNPYDDFSAGATCSCDNDPSIEIAEGSPDASACRISANLDEICSPPDDLDPNPTQAQANYRSCLAEVDTAKQRAQTNANNKAQQRYDELVSTAQGECTSQINRFQSDCSNLPPTAVDALRQGEARAGSGGAQACELNKSSSEQALPVVNSQVTSCKSIQDRVNRLCSNVSINTGDVTSDPQGLSNGQNVTETASRSGSETFITSGSSGSISSKIAALESLVSGLSSLISGADRCIAGIRGTQEPEDTDVADDTDPNAKTTLSTFDSSRTESNAEKTQSNSGELAQGISGLASSIPPGGGGSGSSANTSYGTNYKAYSDSGSTLGDFGGGASGGGNSYSTGSGYKQNNTSFGKNSDPYIKTQDAPSKIPGAANAQASAGSPGGFGGSSGAGGAGLPPASANARSANGRSGRRSAMAKARNLIGGHKRKKQEAGGSGLKARRNLSPQQMKFAFEKANKKFGKGVPLKFDGAKYVPDLKAMKNSRSFRARNARAVAMYEGSKAVEQTLDEKMREKGINPNAGHGMFKTMNIYFRRKFDKASQANGLNI